MSKPRKSAKPAAREPDAHVGRFPAEPELIAPGALDDDGRDLHAMVQALIEEYHPHLKEARIALAWRRQWRASADGRMPLGCPRKVGPIDVQLHGHDFVIELNHTVWVGVQFTDDQRNALLDHQLLHCQVRRKRDGAVKTDKATGRPKWRIRGHDVEEFIDIVRRWGVWTKDIEQMVRDAMDQMAAPPLPFGESSAGGGDDLPKIDGFQPPRSAEG